jgi:uncharacterized protein YgiM (DUF1202 family)
MEGFMNLKKRAIEGSMVAVSLVMMSAIAETAGTVQGVNTPALEVTTKTESGTTYGTAGVVSGMNQCWTAALDEIEQTADVARTDAILVAVSEDQTSVEETTEETVEAVAEEPTEEEAAWENRLMADVEEFLYVRESGEQDAAIVGKLYKSAVAEIVEPGEEWTHITSGNVDGYVSNAYCVTGTDALEYAQENFDTEATVLASGLRVRSEADLDASVLTAVQEGATLVVDTDAETTDEWVAVNYKGTTAYVSSDYVTTDLALTEGVTLEEEAAEKAAQQQAAAEAAAQAAQQSSAATVQNASVAASVDEVTLLAALIQCEAGNECYEGQVAVGAVVMNRVRSGGYPSSIYGVIYQSGQFPPAARGQVASIAANGPKASCVQAAQAALGGLDNTGGAHGFARASSGRAGVVIGNHVFY